MPKTPYEIDSFLNLLHFSEDQEVVVPNFQRRFEWTRDKQTGLAASSLCQLPIGAMVLFNGRRDDFDHRLLCENESSQSTKTDVRFLLDGQQRLSTLRSVFADLFRDYPRWKDTLKSLYPPLQNRWGLILTHSDGGPPLLGIRDGSDVPFLDHGDAASLPYEPSDVRGHLSPFRITQREGERERPAWWHPALQVALQSAGKTESEARMEMAALAAAEDTIPLWELALSAELREKRVQPLHVLAARQIARRAESVLRDLLEEDLRHPSAISVAAQVDPTVHDRAVTLEELTSLILNVSSDWASAVAKTLESAVELQIPTITVASSDLGRAVTIFENINEGGTPLSTFDLVNAKAVPGNEGAPPLRDRVSDVLTRNLRVSEQLQATVPCGQRDVPGSQLTGVSNGELPATLRNQYLNLLSVFGHKGWGLLPSRFGVEYIKREKQLGLVSSQINSATDQVCEALLRASFFLQYRCGVRSPGATAYSLMLLPIAYAFAEEELFESPKVWNKIELWYWLSLFGGRYRERQNEVAVSDIQLLRSWLTSEESCPFLEARSRILDEPRYSDREAFIPSEGEPEVAGAVADAVLQFILSRRPRDFLPGAWKPVTLSASAAAAQSEVQTARPNGDAEVFPVVLQEHHVIPLASVTKIGETSSKLRGKKGSLYNSPLNLTLISQHANRLIGGRSPAQYLQEVPAETLTQHMVTMSGDDIWATITGDDPLGEPPRQDGIRAVLTKRFSEVRVRILERLTVLESGF